MPISSLWPFRTGDDARFLTSDPAHSIYRDIGTDLPERGFEAELATYQTNLWKRGWLQSVVPTAIYGSLIGAMVGMRQAKFEGRYIGRHKIVGRYTLTFAAVGLSVSGMHHFLVVGNGYRTSWYQPVVAGGLGTAVCCNIGAVGSLTQGLVAGGVVGGVYAMVHYGSHYYTSRQLRNFMIEQQQNLVPVHKVAPDLQPAYRAFLHDYRPLEEASQAARRAVIISREEEDTRLDATAIFNTMTPDVYDWISFPEWWPLKLPHPTEDDLLVAQRLQAEEVLRRKKFILESSGAMKHKGRAAWAREN